MSQVKYQVFVSATYEDLKLEREQAIKAILDMGHFPVGMEMFGAADDTQWRIITKTIDQSDYYVVICAHRYGSIEASSKLSYTEKEYDYAVKKKIPALGFVIDEGATWNATYIDKDSAKVTALAAFKEKIRKKYISTWRTADDLYGKVSVALMKEISANPRIGWIRADQVPDTDALVEVSRLSKENASLRSKLETYANNVAQEKKEDFSQILKVLNGNKVMLSFWFKGGSDWEGDKQVTLGRIYNMLATELMIEKSVQEISKYMALMLADSGDRELRANAPTPINGVKRILADFAALDLVAPSSRRHSAADTNEYWTLTDTGREILNLLRRQRLEKGLSAVEAKTAEPADGKRN